MKRSHKTAAGIVAALSLGVAVAAFAQPGPAGDGNGPHGKASMQQHGKMGGMQHGAMRHGAAGMGAGHSLMTPEGATSESDTHTHGRIGSARRADSPRPGVARE